MDGWLVVFWFNLLVCLVCFCL